MIYIISLANNTNDEIKKFVRYLSFLKYKISILPIENGCTVVLYESIKDMDIFREPYSTKYELGQCVFDDIIDFKKFMFKKRIHEKVK